MNLREIDNAIGGLRTSRKNYEAKTQEIALAIIRHAKDHGDCTRALRLCLVLGKREQSQMVNYLAAFSPIKVTLGKDATKHKVKFAERDSKTYNDFNIDGAEAIHWLAWGKPPKAPKEYSLTSFREDLQKLLKRYETMIKDGKVDDAEDVVEDIRAFRTTAADRGAAKKTPVRTQLADEILAASSWGQQEAA